MKILVITQYYLPEPGATSNRLSSFVEAMAGRGHEVTVLCEFPNQPTGILSAGDRWRLFRIERNETHRIIRTFVVAFRKKTNIRRIIFYLSFALSSMITGLLLRRHDIVFASSPPTFHLYTSMIVAGLKRSRFIIDIRDLLADAAQDMGTVRNGVFFRISGYLDRKSYEKASLILTATRGFKTQIDRLGGSGKTHVAYNGSDDDMLSWDGDRDALRRSMGWEDKIVVGFIGSIGLPQNPEELLPEIAALRDDGRFLFVFVGDGPKKEALRRAVDESGIGSLNLYDHVTRKEAISLTYAADIMLIILRELEFSRSTIPSKFFDSMAAGKPIVSNVDGEMREMMEKHATGIYFSYKEKGSFRIALKKMAGDPELMREFGENGRRLVREKFLRRVLAEDAVRIIEQPSFQT